jgi:hypothetical protein
MGRTAALFPIALAIVAAHLAPEAGAQPTGIATCTTINQSGSYVLQNNLTTTGDCLVITAGFVTIDLAGFSITGSGPTVGTAIGIPIGPQGFPGIAVRNGTISNFEFGVSIGSHPTDEGGIVEGLRVADVQEGIFAIGIVKGNTVNCGPESLLGIGGSGTVTGNYIANCGSVGIGTIGAVSGNTVVSSGTGISVQGTAIGNSAMGNTVGIAATCPSLLVDNVATNNGTNLVLHGTGCKTEDNVAP